MFSVLFSLFLLFSISLLFQDVFLSLQGMISKLQHLCSKEKTIITHSKNLTTTLNLNYSRSNNSFVTDHNMKNINFDGLSALRGYCTSGPYF